MVKRTTIISHKKRPEEIKGTMQLKLTNIIPSVSVLLFATFLVVVALVSLSSMETNHDLSSIFKGPMFVKAEEYTIGFDMDESFVNDKGIRNGIPSSRDGSKNGIPFQYYQYDESSLSYFLHNEYATYPNRPNPIKPLHFQKQFAMSGKYQPQKCRKHPHVVGFDNISTLRLSLQEMNDAYEYAVQRFRHYNAALMEYNRIRSNATHSNGRNIHIQPPPPLPQYIQDFLNIPPEPYIICPHTRLVQYIHPNPLYINFEDAIITCTGCIIDMRGSHMSFGKLAKNALVQGITFKGATDSSIIFRENGAEVIFEECFWTGNAGTAVQGSVLDMDSKW